MVRRRGFTLLEISAAGILLAVMMTICLQFFRATAAQRRAIQDHRTAIREADNLMERVCARPWEELTPEGVAGVQLSEEARRALGGSQVEIDVTQPDDEPDGKRITVLLRWPAGPDQPDRSVWLVAWRYRGVNN